MQDRIRLTTDALLGQAVGDAFGVPLEFLSRRKVRSIDPQEMLGADTKLTFYSDWGVRIPRGSWSDDTSMALASMASFIGRQGAIDCEDQLRQFVRWWDDGAYCSLDHPFGLGGTVSDALQRYRQGTPALECGGRNVMDNGNGALMRILPFSLYCIFHQLPPAETAVVTGNGSAITHGHEISRLCCFIWTELLRSIAETADTETAIDHVERMEYCQWFSAEAAEAVRFVTEKNIRSLSERDIGQTGYVVDTLYSALFSLCHANSFEQAVRNAVLLGFDTDTAAAVTGTAAGMLYGTAGIPPRWLEQLKKKDMLEDMAKRFALCFPQ